MILGGTISQALAPGSAYYLRVIHNPLGAEGLPNYGEPIQTLNFTLVFVSAGSLFVRRLRASGVERQQLKRFTYTSTLAISGTILTYTISEALGAQWLKWAGFALMQVGLVGVPISMGIAILRYRLYEIDLIINRTLVYGSLTAMLVALYFGGIVVLQSIFVVLAEEKSTLAVVASIRARQAFERNLQAFRPFPTRAPPGPGSGRGGPQNRRRCPSTPSSMALDPGFPTR